jgi:hypothetical protein
MVRKVAAVQAAAPSLKKGERSDAGFNFVGIDAFYEKVASVALENGLSWVTVEDGIEIMPMPTGEVLVCQKFHADLLDTEDGTVAEDFFRLTIPAPFSDAQTAGISLSYFDKALMRSLFKVVTGEKDADHMARPRGNKASKPSKAEVSAANEADPLPDLDDQPDPNKADKVKQAARPKKAEKQAESQAEDDSPDVSSQWKVIGDTLMAKLNTCKTSADLEQFRVDEQGEINKLKVASKTDADADEQKERVQKLFSAKYEEYGQDEEE